MFYGSFSVSNGETAIFSKSSNAIMIDAAISSNVGKGKKDLHFGTWIVIIKLYKIRTNICFYV